MTTDAPCEVRFDELPPLNGRRPPGATVRRREGRLDMDRRAFLERVTAAGMALGLASLTIFPPGRAFAESAAGRHDILNSCPSYALGHNCSPGCGPSVVRLEACGPNGFHEGTGCFYRLRPNECVGNWDGWRWRPTGCGPCGSAKTTYQCHDGFTCPNSCGGCYRTICRSFQGCS